MAKTLEAALDDVRKQIPLTLHQEEVLAEAARSYHETIADCSDPAKVEWFKVVVLLAMRHYAHGMGSYQACMQLAKSEVTSLAHPSQT